MASTVPAAGMRMCAVPALCVMGTLVSAVVPPEHPSSLLCPWLTSRVPPFALPPHAKSIVQN